MGAARGNEFLSKLALVRPNGRIGDFENLGNTAIIRLDLEDLRLGMLWRETSGYSRSLHHATNKCSARRRLLP